jgi:membrane carboxypeptidase/penicillin-binding protein
MPTVTQTIKFRNQRRNKEQHNPWLKIGLGFGIILSLFGVIGSLAGLWFYTNITRELPSINVLPSLMEPPDGVLLQPTRFYDRTNQHIILTLENPAVAGKRYLQVGKDGQTEQDQFSQYLIDATIVAHDPGFWNHDGYRVAGWSEGTHLTLAQQMVSDLVLLDEPASLQRNIRERLLAAQITEQYGREKILEWYLNSAQYGDLIYGADAAAHAYFGKSATMLNLAEATMLSAISKTPAINPFTGSQVLKQQQEQIIQAMLGKGLISKTDAQKAMEEDLHFQPELETHPIAPAFTDLVLAQLSSRFNLERLRRGGYDVVTTLDYGLQVQANCATETQIVRIQGIQEPSINVDNAVCEAAQLLPNLQLSLDNPLQDIHANVIVLNPQSGQILAFVGDETSGTDPAYPTEHQAGTILSPFLYLTAFTRGMSPATLLWDIPSNSGNNNVESDQNGLPQGMSVTYHGPVRARVALVNDYLAAAAEVLQQVREDNVLLTEKRFGITTPELQLVPEVTIDDLYSRKATLLESISAYAVLANQGVMVGQPNLKDSIGNDPDGLSPTSILQVIGVDGQRWLDWSEPQSRPIISQQLAYLATNVLSDETARRPSLGHPNSLEIGRPAAAKVGMTDKGDDAWAVGYIPKLAIGVWMGHLQEETGGISWNIPAGLWHAIIKYASSQMPIEDFNIPDGISLVQVCDPSGLLVSELCPTVVQEAFLNGNEPMQVDNLYQKYYVNRESGLLATIFTPSDMLEEKVYLVVPPQAVAWASKAGLPIPPDTYDDIHATQPVSPDVRITHPKTFDQVRGEINFIGSAAGSGFSYYRLQVGQGLNPQRWIQIGEDVDQPVNNGLLGTWDTNGLEGLYVVQLLVVRQDQRVEHDILQLAIDNTKPQVQIIAPTDGERIAFQQGESIMMQVFARDNLVLERVEFLVDGELKMTLLQPPFIILWPARLGEHSLLVRAYDLAGNISECTTSFSVNK